VRRLRAAIFWPRAMQEVNSIIERYVNAEGNLEPVSSELRYAGHTLKRVFREKRIAIYARTRPNSEPHELELVVIRDKRPRPCPAAALCQNAKLIRSRANGVGGRGRFRSGSASLCLTWRCGWRRFGKSAPRVIGSSDAVGWPLMPIGTG
jgi:hypothetical protein